MKKMPRKNFKELPLATHGSVDKRGNASIGVAGTGKSAKKSPFYPRKKRA